MNVSELYDLTHWIDSEIVGTEIVQKYQALHSILRQHTQPNQPKRPFESEKDDLINALKNVPLDQLTKDQLEFLSKLGISQAVGKEGIESIEDILYKNVIDVATSAKNIQQMIEKFNNGIEKSGRIKAGLAGCVFEEEYETDNEVLIRVSFTGNAKMSNVSDFKSWGNIWYEIGRGIAMAHGSSPEEVKIVGATKGSIIIELATALTIATTTSGIILAALKVAEKVLDIRKKAEELRNLKLRNGKLVKDLEKEAENEKKEGIKEISNRLVNKLKLKKEGEGDKVTALEKAVNNLVNFIENGGEVDFIVPEDEDVDQEGEVKPNKNRDELRVAFQEIRKLERKLALLEHKNP